MLNEETVVILGMIYRDFLTSQNEHEKLMVRDNNQLFVTNLEELRQITQQFWNESKVVENLDYYKHQKDFSKACSQIWKVLKALPRDVIDKIPMAEIVEIKKHRTPGYVYKKDIKKCCKCAKLMLAYLINKYSVDIEDVLKNHNDEEEQ